MFIIQLAILAALLGVAFTLYRWLNVPLDGEPDYQAPTKGYTVGYVMHYR